MGGLEWLAMALVVLIMGLLAKKYIK